MQLSVRTERQKSSILKYWNICEGNPYVTKIKNICKEHIFRYILYIRTYIGIFVSEKSFVIYIGMTVWKKSSFNEYCDES